MSDDGTGPMEIERKFRVLGDDWRCAAAGVPIRQGYLAQTASLTIRVRLGEGRGHLALKEMKTGISRAEFEYEIPATDAEALLRHRSGTLIEKERYRVEHRGHVWEVDVFAGANAGLVVAEIELHREEEAFERPDWLGDEVSHIGRYYNANLSQYPYARWSEAERSGETER